jgi:hypothetical protein
MQHDKRYPDRNSNLGPTVYSIQHSVISVCARNVKITDNLSQMFKMSDCNLQIMLKPYGTVAHHYEMPWLSAVKTDMCDPVEHEGLPTRNSDHRVFMNSLNLQVHCYILPGAWTTSAFIDIWIQVGWLPFCPLRCNLIAAPKQSCPSTPWNATPWRMGDWTQSSTHF